MNFHGVKSPQEIPNDPLETGMTDDLLPGFGGLSPGFGGVAHPTPEKRVNPPSNENTTDIA